MWIWLSLILSSELWQLSSSAEAHSQTTLRDFTQAQFEKFNGKDESKRYVAIENVVYDLAGRVELHEFSGKFLSIIELESVNQMKTLPIVGRISQPPSNLKLTRKELAEYRGSNSPLEGRLSPQVFVSISGLIFDVSYGGYHLYGPDGPYRIFAGRDASRALGKMSMEASDLDSCDLSDLSQEQTASLVKWLETFQSKYPLVGALITT
jgi:membrane-associated progesterone receptor component